VALALGGGTLLYSLFFYPAPSIDGYQTVADYVAKNAPPNAVVLFSGYRDGNFIFDLRAHEERDDIATLRSDKLLLRIRIERARGVGQSDYDETAIAKLLRDAGVNLIVYQPGFWEDLREMSRLASVIHSPNYERIASFAIRGTVGHSDNNIEIYRPTYPIARRQKTLMVDMPIIGDQFSGRLGSN